MYTLLHKKTIPVIYCDVQIVSILIGNSFYQIIHKCLFGLNKHFQLVKLFLKIKLKLDGQDKKPIKKMSEKELRGSAAVYVI